MQAIALPMLPIVGGRLITNQVVASSPTPLSPANPTHYRNIRKALGRHFAALLVAMIDSNCGLFVFV